MGFKKKFIHAAIVIASIAFTHRTNAVTVVEEPLTGDAIAIAISPDTNNSANAKSNNFFGGNATAIAGGGSDSVASANGGSVQFAVINAPGGNASATANASNNGDAQAVSSYAMADGGDGLTGGGGSATASATGIATDNSPVQVVASALGGAGNGGGTATLGTVFGQSDGGAVTVSGSIYGGDGNLGGGNGFSVSAINAVDGFTSGDLTLTQRLAAGSAGYQAGAIAGSAYSELNKSTASTGLTLNVSASGGSGALGYGGDGGNATVKAAGFNSEGSVTIDARSSGGLAGYNNNGPTGKRGNAFTSATGIAAGNGNVNITAIAQSSGGLTTLGTVYGQSESGAVKVVGKRFGSNGPIRLLNAIDGSTSGSLYLEQDIFTGGTGEFSASSELSKTGAFTDLTVSTSAEVALGFYAQTPLGNGSALAKSEANNTKGNSTSSATAIGGSQFHDSSYAGGDALASAIASGNGDELKITSVANAIAGNGSAPLSGSSGDGGAAVANASAVVNGKSDATVFVKAQGGNGGHPIYSSGNGGNGGVASFGQVFGSSLGGEVKVTGILIGGSGGGGYSEGVGGNGASQSAINLIDGSTTGRLSIEQGAFGGNAGYGFETAGTAGSGYSELNKAGAWTQLSLTANAGGGDAGQALIGSNGASATAKSTATNTLGASLSTANARGGKGGSNGPSAGSASSILGTGGDAVAESIANGNGDFQNVISNATSVAGAGGGFYLGQGGLGGASIANASGIANGNSSVLVTANAKGGDGGTTSIFPANPTGIVGNGGSATATAYAKNTGNQSVTSHSNASGGTGTVNGQATALASSLSTGGGDTKASAFTSGTSGLADASATTTQATGLIRSVSTSAKNSASGFTAAYAQSSIGSAAPSVNPYFGIETASYAIALPQKTDVNAALKNSPNVKSNFDVGGKSDILGLGLLSARTDGSQYNIRVSNHFQFDTSLMPNSLQNLLVGFNGLLANGSLSTIDSLALEIEINNVSVFTQNFTDLTIAETTLNDKTFDLGAWSSLTSPSESLFDLQMSIVLNTTNAVSFSTNFIIGNSTLGSGTSPVPVPAAVWLFVSGLLGLTSLTRKRKTN